MYRDVEGGGTILLLHPWRWVVVVSLRCQDISRAEVVARITLEGRVGFTMQSNLAEPLVSRDLDAARLAYERGGNAAADASRQAHSIAVDGMAVEQHEQNGGHLKAIVFGGLDGILTSFAIIAGSVGANLSPVAMLALGISNVLADALSMGAGEFLSSRSYNAYVIKEREREAWELQNYPAGEIAEMVELFVARGMSRDDAQFVIQRMAKYKVRRKLLLLDAA